MLIFGYLINFPGKAESQPGILDASAGISFDPRPDKPACVNRT
jgi:hypothetical protein